MKSVKYQLRTLDEMIGQVWTQVSDYIKDQSLDRVSDQFVDMVLDQMWSQFKESLA